MPFPAPTNPARAVPVQSLFQVSIFFWLQLKRKVGEKINPSIQVWAGAYDISLTPHPVGSTDYAWKFARQASLTVLQGESEAAVEKLEPHQISVLIDRFLEKADPALPEYGVLSIMRPRIESFCLWLMSVDKLREFLQNLPVQSPDEEKTEWLMVLCKGAFITRDWMVVLAQVAAAHLFEVFRADQEKGRCQGWHLATLMDRSVEMLGSLAI